MPPARRLVPPLVLTVFVSLCSCGPQQPTPTDATPATGTGLTGRPSGTPAESPEAAGEREAANRHWIREPNTIDWVTVRVCAIRVGPTRVRLPDGDETASGKANLNIRVEITVEDKSKLVTYDPWHAPLRPTATVRDNLGNQYLPIEFGSNTPVGRPATTSVRAGEGLFDVFAFDTPLATAEYLDLDLPAANVGLTAKNGRADPVFRFRLSLNNLESEPDTQPEPAPEPKVVRKPDPTPEPKTAPTPEPVNPKPAEPKPQPKPEPEIETITLTPPRGGNIILSDNADMHKHITDRPDSLPEMVRKGYVRRLTEPTDVEVVKRENGLTHVKLGTKVWVLATAAEGKTK